MGWWWELECTLGSWVWEDGTSCGFCRLLRGPPEVYPRLIPIQRAAHKNAFHPKAVFPKCGISKGSPEA